MFTSYTISISLKRFPLVVLVTFLMVLGTGYSEAKPPKNHLKDKNVLVYTKNGEGFVHDNIPNAVASLERLAAEYKFKITVTDAPAFFTDGNLQTIDLIVFPSTNNEVFTNDDQRLAFRRYIQSGGGLVGIHSAVGTERNWEWFKMLIGGRFVGHPKYQKLAINKMHGNHVSLEGIPDRWEKEDECYLMKELYPGIKVIMAHDLTSLNGEQNEMVMELSAPFHRFYPAVWHQDFDGGLVWVTALGHHKKDYDDPMFLKHIFQGMNFIASGLQKRDYSKAYANEWNSPVKFK